MEKLDGTLLMCVFVQLRMMSYSGRLMYENTNNLRRIVLTEAGRWNRIPMDVQRNKSVCFFVIIVKFGMSFSSCKNVMYFNSIRKEF